MPLPAKLTAPEPGPHFVRAELVRQLGEFARSPGKVWIGAPGGSGKTTLVRTSLAGDPRPLIWYQVDHSDSDPASLFFYLAQRVGDDAAAPQLPSLTPEYLPNMATFCHNFFRAFFARFPQGCILVFDDLQEGSGADFLGPALRAVMAELPAHSSLLMLSREEPYPCFARERLNRSLMQLGWNELQLSPEESGDFLAWCSQDGVSPQTRTQAYHATHGWLAGLLLFVENRQEIRAGEDFAVERTELLFDYFAGEIFARLAPEIRSFLLVCAQLPTIDAALAGQLSQRGDAGEILERLAKGNHFTFRISAAPDSYRFHPLFRQFLLSRSERQFEAAHLTELRTRAAQLLAAQGQCDPAAELLIQAGAWEALIGLIQREAEPMLSQGRWQTLLQWLEALPAHRLDGDPWLGYWRGSCQLSIHPAGALENLTRSFALFWERDDPLGCMLSWGMAVYAITVGWSEYARLDEWIARFDPLRERYPNYPSPAIEALMVQGILKALTWRQPERDDLPQWSERLQHLIVASRDSGFRLLAGSDLVFYHTIAGNLGSARALVGLLDEEMRNGQVTPLQSLVWLATRAVLEWIVLERERCLATMEEGRVVIADSGIHLLDLRLFGQGVTLGLTTGDLSLARQLLEQVPQVPTIAPLDHSFLFHLSGDLALLEGDAVKAIALAEMAVKTAEDGGSPTPICFSLAGLFLALHQAGRRERAAEVLRRGLAASNGMNYFLCMFQLLAAHFALEKGERDEAHDRLRQGLGLGARQGYLNLHPWRDALMTQLCREALDAGIEPDYVRRLAAARNLDLTPVGGSILTPKELEVLDWIRQGKTNWEMARILAISERTVKFHAANILRKLDASSRSHAVAKALDMGLLSS